MKAKREGVFEKEEVINCSFRSNDEEAVCEEDSLLLKGAEKRGGSRKKIK